MTEEKTLLHAEIGDVIIQMKVIAPEENHKALTILLQSMGAFLLAVDSGHFWSEFGDMWGGFIMQAYAKFLIVDAKREGRR